MHVECTRSVRTRHSCLRGQVAINRVRRRAAGVKLFQTLQYKRNKKMLEYFTIVEECSIRRILTDLVRTVCAGPCLDGI